MKYNKNGVTKVTLEKLRRTYSDTVTHLKIIMFQNKKHRIVGIVFKEETAIYLQKIS